MIYGGDYLAGCKFQKAMLRAHKPGFCAGIFLRTFGDARKTVRAMAQSGKFSEILVHVAPFDKTHEYKISKYKKQLMLDAKWLQGVASENTNTKILLSPFCEHNWSRAVMQPLFMDLESVAPACLMVNTIWKGQVVPGTITELHLANSKKLPAKPNGEYIISFDGFGGDGSGNSPDCDVQAIINKYSDARQIRIWNFRFNGKFAWDDKTAIENRKNWPSEEYIRGHLALLKQREGSIAPDSMLYKNFAEDSPTDPKANKAMVILPVDLDQVKVFDSNGKIIDFMRRMKPDFNGKPKGARYYSSRYASQLGDLAEKSSGSRKIKIHNSPYFDADLRGNYFR